MQTMEVFARRLKELRKRRGISGVALGELCGISKNSIYTYEAGQRRASITTLCTLADYFEVSTDYLLGRVD